MANLTIAEGYISHRAEDRNATDRQINRCQVKNKLRWPWTNNLVDGKASLVKFRNGKYGITFTSGGSEMCSHMLPEPGLACIMRHNSNTKSKCLFISQVQTDQNQGTWHIFLQFQDGKSYLSWETKMREKLQVYSFNITVPKDQNIDSGEAVIHVTPKYILITKVYDKNRYKSVYIKDTSALNIAMRHGAGNQSHVIEFRSYNGCKDEIKFFSKNFDDIKNSIQMFRNTSRIKNNVPRWSRSDNSGTRIGAESADKGIPDRYNLSESPSSRYAKFGQPLCNDVYVSARPKSCKPHIYSYIDLSKVKTTEYQRLVSEDNQSQASSHGTHGSYQVKVRTLSEVSAANGDNSLQSKKFVGIDRRVEASCLLGGGNGFRHEAPEFQSKVNKEERSDDSAQGVNDISSLIDLMNRSIYDEISDECYGDVSLDSPTNRRNENTGSRSTKYEDEEMTVENECASHTNYPDINQSHLYEETTHNDDDSTNTSPSPTLQDVAIACDSGFDMSPEDSETFILDPYDNGFESSRSPPSIPPRKKSSGYCSGNEVSPKDHAGKFCYSNSYNLGSPLSPPSISPRKNSSEYQNDNTVASGSLREISMKDHAVNLGDSNSYNETLGSPLSPPSIPPRKKSSEYQNTTRYCNGNEVSSKDHAGKLIPPREKTSQYQNDNTTVYCSGYEVCPKDHSGKLCNSNPHNETLESLHSSPTRKGSSESQRSSVKDNCTSVQSENCEKDLAVPSSKEPVKLLVSLFATEMDLGGAWTIGVIIVQRQDTETFKLLKCLEEEYGRHQLTTPRTIDATSDIVIQARDCSDGFEVICCEPQTLKYSDLKQLGPMKWIVAEFQFLHIDETKPIFKCHICIGGPEHHQDSGKSVFTSQKIPVVKKFPKPGTSPTLEMPKSRLEITAKNRFKLCQSLDLPSALGNNWKSLAAEIGFDNMQIRIIENCKQESHTEQVLQILETNFIGKCNKDYLRTVFKEIGRLDVLELLY